MFEELRKCENTIINVPPRMGKANFLQRAWDLPEEKIQCKGCDYFNKYLVKMSDMNNVKAVGECSKLDMMVSKSTYLSGDCLKSCPLSINGKKADYDIIDDPLWLVSYAIKKGMKP